MTLKEYKRKRKFSETSEPQVRSEEKKPNTNKVMVGDHLRFVVQKHDARRLHYDFRLEMVGVLKSWAIPKGPSLNPNDKRLAIMVEDHPYDYKDFEGVIPKGNYGAGRVIIWDEGFYEAAEPAVSDPNQQLLHDLHKGHLRFILHGRKLKGEFNLIKIKNDPKNTWLFIKKKDKFSTTKSVLLQNQSVRTGEPFSTASEIASEILQNAPTAKMPTGVCPMLAHLGAKPFTHKGWLFEIKWDGFRIMAYVDKNKVRLVSRNQQDYTENFVKIADTLRQLGIAVVLDGELVVLDRSGRAQFQLLQQFIKTGKGQLVYCVFDVLWLKGKDLQSLPLLQRKQILKAILPALPNVIVSDYILAEGEAFFAAVREQSLEGIMAKNAASSYQSGHRSRDWLKIKVRRHQEAVIGGFTSPRGSRQHFGALILGVYENEQLIYVGHVGGGFNAKSIAELKQRLDKLVQAKSPFSIIPKTNTPVTWVKPLLVCEVAFAEWTADGLMRQPVFLRLREDKTPGRVGKEVEESALYNEKPNEDEQNIIVNRRRIKLVNLKKIFWPHEGFQKQDVIDYYRSVANFILPYLKDRPQSLHRHPNGIYGDHFFQKNFPEALRWVKTQVVHSESEDRNIHYIVCQDEATLIYMANLGCIEINPWLSRISALDKPDFCVLDLDPENIEFSAVVKVAQAIHRLLEKIEVSSFCKTSGATGLHIYIPLHAKYSYEQSQYFSQLIATIINIQLPDITSIIRAPVRRQGKVYLDFLQNRKGQTMVAPYSLRPRPQAPISTPLAWKEVTQRLDPLKFNLKTLLSRLDRYGDLWQPVLGRGVDLASSVIALDHFWQKMQRKFKKQ